MDTQALVHEWLQRWFAGVEVMELEPGIPLGDQLGSTVEEMVALHDMPDVPAGSTFEPNVVYGSGGGRELTLQLWRRADARERAPGIVFIHGGGWGAGHPYMHMRHASELVAKGFVAASISYRFATEAQFPGPLEDAKCAVRFMRANASSFGLDPDRIAVAGGSAGGHLSAMVALTPGRFEGNGGHASFSSAAQAAVLWYPATDLRVPPSPTELKPAIDALVGATPPGDASPISYVRSDAPPMLSMTGTRDALTPYPMIRDFHVALDAAGATNHLQTYEGAPHGFDFAPSAWHDCYTRMSAWLDRYL